jgi:Predicted flavoprotein involved in K+ transport
MPLLPKPPSSVIIIGGGFSGLAMACQLERIFNLYTNTTPLSVARSTPTHPFSKSCMVVSEWKAYAHTHRPIAEKNYNTYDRETLAITYALERWFHISEGPPGIRVLLTIVAI